MLLLNLLLVATICRLCLQAPSEDPQEQQLYDQVAKQGDLVRKLKTEKAGKEKVDAAVKVSLV